MKLITGIHRIVGQIIRDPVQRRAAWPSCMLVMFCLVIGVIIALGVLLFPLIWRLL